MVSPLEGGMGTNIVDRRSEIEEVVVGFEISDFRFFLPLEGEGVR